MSDLSGLSDAALMDMYQRSQPNPAKMSDAELQAAYAAHAAPPQEGGAVTDIIPEIKNAASENMAAIKEGFAPEGGKAQQGTIGGLMSTGKGLLGIAGLAASPITGAARSLLGHPLADAEHAIGGVINPQVATQDDPAQMYSHAKEGVDTAMMALKPSGATPRGIGTMPAPSPSIADLKTSARAVWNDPAIKTAPISGVDATRLASGSQNDLLAQGFRPTTGSAPGTFAEVQRMTPPAGVSVTVDDLRAARRALNMTAKQRDPIGGLTPDALAAKSVIEKIDNTLDSVSPKLRDANADYAAAKTAELLDYRSMKAEHRAARSGSGSNIENTLRQEVDKIPNRGLKPAEIALRDQITEGTPVRNTLRKVGKLGFNDGLSVMYHAGMAIPTGGANLPVGVAATIARKVGEALTTKQIRDLNEMIRARTPLARSMPPLQAPAPPPMFGATIPYQFSQGLPFFRGAVPAYADQNEPGRRR